MLRAHNPGLDVLVVSDKAALEELSRAELSSTRLLAFCSPIIVPARLLDALPGPAYNFHPGPPDRPGRFPSVFAIYERSETFGVTVHEMREQVDTGPIVAAEWFRIPDNADVVALEKLALGCLVAIFKRVSGFLALNPGPLPRIFIPWSGTKRTKAECELICRITPELPAHEVELRRRACGSLLRP